jgi:hypothetical protein
VFIIRKTIYTGCPTRYQTQHFFNNFTTNKNIATKFETDLLHCVRNVKEKNVLLFKFRCNIFIVVRIIKEMPGSVASGTSCTCSCLCYVLTFICLRATSLSYDVAHRVSKIVTSELVRLLLALTLEHVTLLYVWCRLLQEGVGEAR